MSTPRRNFLKDLLVAGTLPALLASPCGVEAATEMLDQAAQSNAQGATLEFDKETYNYWANYMTPGKPLPGGNGVGRGNKLGLSPISGTALEREPAFLHYDAQGFRTPDQIQPKELAPPQGDVSVQFSVAAFKPANEDRATFEKLQSGSLRVDMVQNQPSMIAGISDFAAWTAIAALMPDKSGKLPPLSNLVFDPNSTWSKPQDMMLPGGTGHWGISLGVQRKDGLFSQILNQLSTEVGRFAPALGLPGIASSAFTSFNRFFGLIHSLPQWIFKSDGIAVYATSDSWKESGAGTSRGLPLRTGNYVIVPQKQTAAFQKDMKDLVMRQNFIVEKNYQGLDLYGAAQSVLQNVTYATLAVQVKGSQAPCAVPNKT
ncbi:MAG TPA: hypothetical protein VKR82_03020 [Candidatus Acidoferrales bacterium]|nr:hypothetical protein [Candidatus Acidoferrales bacterium]